MCASFSTFWLPLIPYSYFECFRQNHLVGPKTENCLLGQKITKLFLKLTRRRHGCQKWKKITTKLNPAWRSVDQTIGGSGSNLHSTISFLLILKNFLRNFGPRFLVIGSNKIITSITFNLTFQTSQLSNPFLSHKLPPHLTLHFPIVQL